MCSSNRQTQKSLKETLEGTHGEADFSRCGPHASQARCPWDWLLCLAAPFLRHLGCEHAAPSPQGPFPENLSRPLMAGRLIPNKDLEGAPPTPVYRWCIVESCT